MRWGRLARSHTVPVQEDGEEFSVVRAGMKENGWRLAGAKAQRYVLSFQHQV